MRQGLKKFDASTQGGRTRQGALIGENYVSEILEVLGIKNIKEEFGKRIYYKELTYKTSLEPDFIVENTGTAYKDKEYIFIESKFKQISGSDWEKIESNFGFHDWFYNRLAKISCKTIVILSGYWKELENKYPLLMVYFKEYYGKETIFDFAFKKEIERFAKFMNVPWTSEVDNKVSVIYNKYQKIE
ncbi:hypothetical protein ACNQ1O_00835 [Mycoplasma sp. B6188]|uniref:hypothetical protein n=1 Tax=unclassified Mycoplasma TaxID=2683645 RepID=UPI003AAA2DDB